PVAPNRPRGQLDVGVQPRSTPTVLDGDAAGKPDHLPPSAETDQVRLREVDRDLPVRAGWGEHETRREHRERGNRQDGRTAAGGLDGDCARRGAAAGEVERPALPRAASQIDVRGELASEQNWAPTSVHIVRVDGRGTGGPPVRQRDL